MFGSEEILAFIRRQIGVRTDTDDSAGSLHAKIGNLKEVMQNYIKNYTIMQLSTISSNTSSWSSTEQSVTISYNGAGILQNIYIQGSGTTWTSSCRATITIDGIAVPAFGSASGSVAWPGSNVYLFSDSTGKLNVISSRANLGIPFRSSLCVTIYFSVSGGSGGSMVGNVEIYKY
ncbi:Uncharacterized [Syntrophomonas zehnderi OL-4]|uniref:Uncharacterized n=1 Tax=Syntrophomonas zehnderi OL-4 TaxID=690567 RepID=A0A0E4GAX7_9FIRM|nr:hypothetical protein [Syntrophomonas zehnderi]CFX73015.1 Uncharacterized [Syntrophomonas zehnderi OL-4]